MVSDAYRFAVPALLLGVVSLMTLDSVYVAVLLFILAAFVCYFFRNPRRQIPQGMNLIVSPADGKVVKIAKNPANGDQTISIFLNIFNVHVTRSPIAGELKEFEYKRGRFKAAFDEEASRVNEQNIVTIAGEGVQVVVRQIAGLIARRVICWFNPGRKLQRGELFGLIRFGSRVDVTVPEKVRIQARVGDHVKGGSSILGEY